MTLTLYVWPSDFGLPSVGIECLQFMAASKICAAPINFLHSTRPWVSPTGDFPFLHNEKGHQLTNFKSFVAFLRNSEQEILLDDELTPNQISEFDVYECLLRQKLRPAMLYTFWLDSMNYTTMTHYWFSSKLIFPYNLYYVDKKKKEVNSLISAINKTSKQLITEAIQVINLLSAKLGDNKYFCGNKPCSLDALIFGYLALLLRSQIPNDRIQLHLVSTPNLVRFVESIQSIYLPLNEEQLRQHANNKEFWTKRRAEGQRRLGESRFQKEQKEAEKELSKSQSSNYDIGYFALAALSISIIFAIHFGYIPVHADQIYAKRKQKP